MKKVAIIDTSILCCWLKVPGKETCGSSGRKIDYDEANKMIDAAEKEGSFLVLPLATIIETGNHIAHAKSFRYERAEALGNLMRLAANAETPWSAFTLQKDLWDKESLIRLSSEWPEKAARETSLGDATISDIADYYSKMGYEVFILSGDEQLASYVPAGRRRIPRRCKGK